MELETIWVPTENFELSFNWAFLDSEYTDFSGLTVNPSGVSPDFTGNTLRQSPDHSGGVNARYTWGNIYSSGDSLAANISARYISDVFYDPDNNPRGIVRSYAVADARLSYTSPGGKYQLDLWVNNLTDKDYKTHAFTLTGGQRAFANVGLPRWYGATFTYNLN